MAINFSVEDAPVCGFIELLKAGCSFRGEVDVILIENLASKMEGQNKDGGYVIV